MIVVDCTHSELPPLQRFLIEIEALEERLADIAQERAILNAEIDKGVPGARSALVANAASESAIRRMALDLHRRVEVHLMVVRAGEEVADA